MKNSDSLEYAEIIKRLKVIKGHVTAVENMMEKDKSCEEILLQLDAIRASILKTSIVIAQHYAHVCICDALEKGEESQAVVNKSIETLMKINQYNIPPSESTYY